MRVFIVRPFGKKLVTVKDEAGKDIPVEVDFDKIDKLLIQPALARNNLDGVTTEVMAQAGNIRLDMFQMLVAYDLVIADISVDNANVFYELGIRHGLRRKGSILLRFSDTGKDVPFDLKTDRYIAYDRETPGVAVGRLAASIKETIGAIRSSERKPDSPVFLLLPELTEPDAAKLIGVPRDFQEAVARARGDEAHAMLALLSEEAQRTGWAREGLRLVGRAQRQLGSFKAAKETWELIHSYLEDDIEANLQLATIYDHLGDLVSASLACRRVLDNRSAGRKERAEALSKLARIRKAAWVADFNRLAEEAARRQQAISDERLFSAYDGYMEGFAEDLNDYDSGINALELLTAIVKLADMEQAAWVGRFETTKRAANTLDDYQEQLDCLRGAVRMSLKNAKRQVERSKEPDERIWPAEARYRLLTTESPSYVKNGYMAVKNAGGNHLPVLPKTDQVLLYRCLGLFPENCRAALEGLGIVNSGAAAQLADDEAENAGGQKRNRVIVAIGERVDGLDRPPPGVFPNTPACVDKAKGWLREQIKTEKAATTGAISGICGAASGTDLLFHEVCAEFGIPTTVVLPIPKEDYCSQLVADGGSGWVDRFQRLMAAARPVILGDSADLPGWAKSIPNYSVFQRGNIWMIEEALIRPDADVTLLALWNGKAARGPGGTADMVKLADAHAAKVCEADTNKLFGLPD